MISRLRLVLIALLFSTAGLPARAACTDVPAPKVDWRRCTLDGGDFAKSKLTGAELRDASFSLANLAGADLTCADAYHGKFLSTNLQGARLDGANLSESDFTRADLTGASLVGADLRRARFFRSNLRGADFTGAQMTGADLLNADLSGALWTDGKRRCGAGSIGQCN
jgi:uncharacterized protein YjbI with pentapeptide repeats